MIRITESKVDDFEKCLSEAKRLISDKPRNQFYPALDDLVNDDIESIIAKVQHELDMADEGEITTHHQTKRRAKAFIDKWEAYLKRN